MLAGRLVGERLRDGDVVLLSGTLGAGKTTLSKGIVEGYGVRAQVTSPSFALIHEYRSGARLVVHFDPYRLEDQASLRDVGWEEYLGGPAIMLIEWPERLGAGMPRPHILLCIEPMEDDSRTLTLSCDPVTDAPRWSDLWTG